MNSDNNRTVKNISKKELDLTVLNLKQLNQILGGNEDPTGRTLPASSAGS